MTAAAPTVYDNEHEPFKIDSGLIDELEKLNAPIVIFREYVVNALDQYQHPNAKGKKKIVEIQLDKPARRIKIRDRATGILDEDDFKKFGTSKPKTVGDETSDSPDSEIVGSKHIGKLTGRAASESKSVWYYSNNGETGVMLHMDKIGWCKPIHKDTTKVLDEVGMMAVIDDVMYDDLLSPTIVMHYLSKIFALRIARGQAHITVNGKQVKPPANFDSDWGREPLAVLSNGVEIRGNLKHTNGKPKNWLNVQVFENTVGVKSEHMDYNVEGWYNVKKMPLSTDREDFFEDKKGLSKERIPAVEKYLKENGYSRQTEERKNEKLSGVKELEEWMTNIIRDAYCIFELSAEMEKKKPSPSIESEEKTAKETNDQDSEQKYIKQTGVTVRPNEKGEGDEVIILGRGGREGRGGEGEGGQMADVTAGGNQTALVKTRINTQPKQLEPIPPRFEPWRGASTDPIIKFIGPSRVGVNITRPAHLIIAEADGKKRRDIVYPWLVRAYLDYAIQEEKILAKDYLEKHDALLDKGWAQ